MRATLLRAFLYLTITTFCLCHSPMTVPVDDSVIHSTPISNIAFGSCNRQSLPQHLWHTIIEMSPSLWIWLGDAVYADTRYVPLIMSPSPPQKVRDIFMAQKQSEPYHHLTTVTPIIGTWDDHDFNKNNGGKEHEGPSGKEIVQQIYLDFLDVPLTSLRRQRRGVYSSHVYRVDNKNSTEVLLAVFILLDIRYHADLHNSDGDILGEEQWLWLQRLLKQVSDSSRLSGSHTKPSCMTGEGGELCGKIVSVVIGSGIQIIPSKPLTERWSRFPSARRRLFSLLHSTISQPSARHISFLLMSGDVHFSEILTVAFDVDGNDVELPKGNGIVGSVTAADVSSKQNIVVVHEVTSSGLTHSNIGITPMLKLIGRCPHRLGGAYLNDQNFGALNFKFDEDSKYSIDISIFSSSGKKQLGILVIPGVNSGFFPSFTAATVAMYDAEEKVLRSRGSLVGTSTWYEQTYTKYCFDINHHHAAWIVYGSITLIILLFIAYMRYRNKTKLKQK